ncbi:CHAT domain-containing protein [Cyathus striatus]|nr:CHAT domain-containing protein [Cyathus striatus]
MLDTLATSLKAKFEYTGTMEDLEQAVYNEIKAIDLTPEKHPEKPLMLTHLGNTLMVRFENIGNKDDIMKALSYSEQALHLLPEGHPHRIVGHILAGNIFGLLAIINEGSLQYSNLNAAHQWGIHHLRKAYSDEIMDAYTIAFELLPQVISIGYTVAHRYDRLKLIQNFALNAFSIAIIHYQFKKAIEWCEQGCAVVWMQIHSLRNPVDSLRLINPDLAMNLIHVSSQLESATHSVSTYNALESIPDFHSLENETKKHQALAKEWDSLLHKARLHPGFENFLMPAEYTNIINDIPMSGKVVIISAGQAGCDTLVLEHNMDTVVHISLPKFTYTVVVELVQLLHKCLDTTHVRSRESRAGRPAKSSTGDLNHILLTLWMEVVEPIFKRIGILPFSSSANRQRIWWFPMGPLSLLPLHAAGMYGTKYKKGTTTISDYAISSYIPSIGALGNAHKSAQKKQISQGMLAISQANSPDLPPLPVTIPECEFIEAEFSHCHIPVKHIGGKNAIVQDILEQMERSNWIHLACHGSQDLKTPTKSAFHLHNGKIELIDIIRKNLKNADFAFLSACQTATGSPELSSQSAHLAAGMLAAGYRSVVATMWFIDDERALAITKEFYHYLLKDLKKGEFPDSSRAAEALQHAAMKLRDHLGDSDESLMSWVPYVHIGL